ECITGHDQAQARGHPATPGATTAYFPHGETAATRILEGELAFLSHVKAYEDSHPGTRILQPRLVWKYEFLCCCLGRLSRAELEELARGIDEISNMRGRQNSWAVRSSKDFSGLLRHNQRYKLGSYMELTLEQIHDSKVRPSEWQPRKFFSFLASTVSFANISILESVQFRGTFDFPNKSPKQLLESQPPARVYLPCHGEANYESIRNSGLSLQATRQSWQRRLLAGRGTCDEEALRQLISDTELKEAAKQGTQTEGTTRSAYEAGNKMQTPYGDALVKTTPLSSLPKETRKLLAWRQLRLVDVAAASCLRIRSSLLPESVRVGETETALWWRCIRSHTSTVYTNGYKSPFDKSPDDSFGHLLDALNYAQHKEFAL
ncbi:unnamed protein product, partial [Symbiodinium necroappetens]